MAVGGRLGEQLVQSELALAESIKSRIGERLARRVTSLVTLVPPIWFFFLQPVHHALGSFLALTLPQNWVTLIPDVLATMTRPHELVLALVATGLTEAFLLAWIHMRCFRVADAARRRAIESLAVDDLATLLAGGILEPLEPVSGRYQQFEQRVLALQGSLVPTLPRLPELMG